MGLRIRNIVNTEDVRLDVGPGRGGAEVDRVIPYFGLGEPDRMGTVILYVGLGEPNRIGTVNRYIRLDLKQARKLVKALTEALDG